MLPSISQATYGTPLKSHSPRPPIQHVQRLPSVDKRTSTATSKFGHVATPDAAMEQANFFDACMIDLDRSIKNEYAEFRNQTQGKPSPSNWKLQPKQAPLGSLSCLPSGGARGFPVARPPAKPKAAPTPSGPPVWQNKVPNPRTSQFGGPDIGSWMGTGGAVAAASPPSVRTAPQPPRSQPRGTTPRTLPPVECGPQPPKEAGHQYRRIKLTPPAQQARPAPKAPAQQSVPTANHAALQAAIQMVIQAAVRGHVLTCGRQAKQPKKEGLQALVNVGSQIQRPLESLALVAKIASLTPALTQAPKAQTSKPIVKPKPSPSPRQAGSSQVGIQKVIQEAVRAHVLFPKPTGVKALGSKAMSALRTATTGFDNDANMWGIRTLFNQRPEAQEAGCAYVQKMFSCCKGQSGALQGMESMLSSRSVLGAGQKNLVPQWIGLGYMLKACEKPQGGLQTLQMASGPLPHTPATGPRQCMRYRANPMALGLRVVPTAPSQSTDILAAASPTNRGLWLLRCARNPSTISYTEPAVPNTCRNLRALFACNTLVQEWAMQAPAIAPAECQGLVVLYTLVHSRPGPKTKACQAFPQIQRLLAISEHGEGWKGLAILRHL